MFRATYATLFVLCCARAPCAHNNFASHNIWSVRLAEGADQHTRACNTLVCSRMCADFLRRRGRSHQRRRESPVVVVGRVSTTICCHYGSCHTTPSPPPIPPPRPPSHRDRIAARNADVWCELNRIESDGRANARPGPGVWQSVKRATRPMTLRLRALKLNAHKTTGGKPIVCANVVTFVHPHTHSSQT